LSSTPNTTRVEQESTIESWPFHIQCLFGIISILLIFFDKYPPISTYDIDTNTTATLRPTFQVYELLQDQIFKADLVKESIQLMECLARLPCNVHALSALSEESTTSKNHHKKIANDIAVKQRVYGYAIFLHASSINHACAPNAIVRYRIPSSLLSIASSSSSSSSSSDTSSIACQSSLKLSNIDQIQTFLQSIRIEIVTLQSIHYNQEICISYGPIAPTHHWSDRQMTLAHQYLFHGQCLTCQQDYIQYQALKHQVKEEQEESSMTIKLEELCARLIQHRHTLESLNIVITSVLTGIVPSVSAVTKIPSHLRSHPLIRQLLQQETVNNTIHIPSVSSIMEELEEVEDDLEYLGPRHFRAWYPLLISMKPSDTVTINDTSIQQARSIHTIKPPRLPSLSFPNELWKEYCGLWCLLLDMQAHLLASSPSSSTSSLITEEQRSDKSIGSQYLQAARKVQYSIHIMIATAKFVEDDICIARERVKVAELYFHAGDYLSAIEQNELAGLGLYQMVSEDDTDYLDMCRMHHFFVHRGWIPSKVGWKDKIKKTNQLKSQSTK
jgi:hypothetical protein